VTSPADRLDAVALLSLLCGGMPAEVRVCEHLGNPQPKERPRVYGKRTITAPKTVAATAALAYALKSKAPILTSDVAMVCLFFRGDARRCDVDNLGKLVLDAGNKAAIWVDDHQVKALAMRMGVDRDNPRTVVAWCEMSESSTDG
jgi:Holliday junction resolvase RusA-like endonuclease